MTVEPVQDDKTVPETLAASRKPASGVWVKWMVLAWMLAIAVFHLGSAAVGRPIYRDIHLGTALEYAQGSVNLLKPVIVGFNLNGAPTPQEVPLWQATAGLVFKACGPWFGWANLVSLMFAFSTLFPLFKLAERFAGPDCAWWTLLLFLAQPLVFIYAGLASTDGQCLAAAVWFLFFAMKLCEEQNITWLALTVAAGVVAATTKLPFFLAAGLGCALMTVTGPRHFKRSWGWLAAAALMIGAAFLAWTRYVNQCYAQAEQPYVDLRSSDPQMVFWYFGDLKYRLSAGVWVKGAWRVLTTLFGSFGLVGVFLAALVWPGSSRLARWWLAGGVISTLIFFHIVLHHKHYYLMFAPAVAMLCAQLVAWLEAALLALERRRRAAAWLAVVAALALSTVQGVAGMHTILLLDKYPYAIADVIKQHTSKSDKLLIQGGGWGGQMLFLSERKGLSIWNTKLLEDERTYAHLKQLGFTKLVMVSQSRLLAATEQSNSLRELQRQTYHASITPAVQGWPTVVQNDDILIKELP